MPLCLTPRIERIAQAVTGRSESLFAADVARAQTELRQQLDGKRVLDQWTVSSANRDCATVRVKRGWHAFRLEFFQRGGGALIKLLTQHERRLQVVTPERLCCTRSP